MTSKYLQSAFLPFLRRNKFDFAIENIYLLDCESDVLAVKKWKIHEYEFKIGQRDFEKDFKKTRHIHKKPHFFYYVISDLSVISGKYHDYAGIYLHSKSVDGFNLFKLIKEPKELRQSLVTYDELYDLLRKEYNGKKTDRYRQVEG